MRVSRSLTIKQMAAVSAVAVVFIFIFIVVQLYHFTQQRRYDTASQMEKIALSVRAPLSEAILRADIPKAESILRQIQPAGIISRADVVLPNQFQALRISFISEHPVPPLIARLFELPVQISLPLYSPGRPTNPHPLAYLVLQADSWRMYKYIISTVSTLLTTWLLLALILSVSISWVINRLVIHPLRHMARELNDITPHSASLHQLKLPRLHHDDEIGMVIRSYNRNQQMALRQHQQINTQATWYALTNLPNKTLLLALLEQLLVHDKNRAVMVITCETLQNIADIFNEKQRENLLVVLVQNLKRALPTTAILTQSGHSEFAVITPPVKDIQQIILLIRSIQMAITETLSIGAQRLKPGASIGIAIHSEGVTAQQLYRRAISAALSARRTGENQFQFFTLEHTGEVQRWIKQEQKILEALRNQHFTFLLAPQVALHDGALTAAQASITLPDDEDNLLTSDQLTRHIATCGLTLPVGLWMIETACRTLSAWQKRGIMLPLCIDISSLHLLQNERLPAIMNIVTRYQVHPNTLTLEISQTQYPALCHSYPDVVTALRQAGIRIALNIAAKDAISLHELKAWPVDILKLDKSITGALPDDSTLADTLILFARACGIILIAGGVEHLAQLEWLKSRQVQLAQGRLFAPELSSEAFEIHHFSVNKK